MTGQARDEEEDTRARTHAHTQNTYVVSQHERSRLNDELIRFFVSDHRGCQTGRCTRLAARVDGSGAELLNLPETTKPRPS